MSGNNVFLNEARILEKKWEQTGLLSGISDAYTRKVTSVVLENQRLAL